MKIELYGGPLDGKEIEIDEGCGGVVIPIQRKRKSEELPTIDMEYRRDDRGRPLAKDGKPVLYFDKAVYKPVDGVWTYQGR